MPAPSARSARPGAHPTGSPSPGFLVRAARPDELGRAAVVRARSWQQAFRGLLPDAMLDGFADSVWTERLVAEWRDLVSAGGTVWVALDAAGGIVGVAQSEPDTDPAAPAPIRLSKLYLLDAAKGTGLADRLLHRTIGNESAYLWVLDGNERAQAFYRRHGFELDGAFLHLEDDLAHVREVRMVRAGER